MKREFLEGFGLDKEAVDKIMQANGDDIQNARQSEAQKFSTERESLNQKITDLTAQGEQRDTDLKTVKEQLAAAQTDAGKLADVQKSLTDLQGKYDSERKEWENRDKQQRYEFAVKTAAAGLKFSSDAAKNYFVSQAIGAGLKMSDKDGSLLGFSEYAAQYKESDPGAFVSEEPPKPAEPVPSVVTGTNAGNGTPNAAQVFHLNYTGVRPHTEMTS